MELPNLPDWLKVSTTHMAAVAVAAAVLLFSPASLLARLGVAELVDDYKMWIGLVLLVSGSVLVARLLAAMARSSQTRIGWWSTKRTGHKRLCQLTPGEATALARYIDSDTRTQYFNLEDGLIGGLVAEHILFRSSNISRGHTSFAFNIQPWAWSYLKKHPEALAAADRQEAQSDRGRLRRSNF